MIKKPHLDHTQALSSYVSGSLGTLKKCFYGLEIFSNPLIDFTTKRSNKSRRVMLEVKAFSVFKAVLIYYAVRIFAKVKGLKWCG
ncbi:hypothetical protein HpBGD72_10710 [Helicobacter pylori]